MSGYRDKNTGRCRGTLTQNPANAAYRDKPRIEVGERLHARGQRGSIVLQGHAGQPPPPRFAHQPREPVRRRLDSEAGGMDVGEAVALRIAPAEPRLPREVDPEAVGDAQARPLADHHRAEPRAEAGRDLVAERHAGLDRDHDRRHAPADEPRQTGGEQRRGMALHGRRRKPVGDDEDEVVIARGKRGQASRVEPPPEVGPPQVGLAIGRAAADDYRLAGQGGGESDDIERRVHRVAGAPVRQLKGEDVAGA